MKRLRYLVFGLTLVTALASTAHAGREIELGDWIAGDLVPYVRQQLSTHPRFAGQTVQVVMLGGDAVLAAGNALSLGVADRLRKALSVEPGIRLLWQAPPSARAQPEQQFDCSQREADYLIGIDAQEVSPGAVVINVRALDWAERSWVSGFARRWQGRLSSRQVRDLRTRAIDPAFRGERHAPWEETETDLMAAQLAFEIGCGLLRQTDGEYMLDPGPASSGDNHDLVELVSNNLAAVAYFQFATEDQAANARITGKAHRIDDDLYQYWITILPQDGATDLTAISADAYVRVSPTARSVLAATEESFDFQPGNDSFIDDLSLVRLHRKSLCEPGTVNASLPGAPTASWSGADGSCFALQLDSGEDAVAFFLNHQLNHGLVHLSTGDCSGQNKARVIRKDAALQFPLPLQSVGSWMPAKTWSLDPAEDTYLVLASRDTRAARALAAHVEKLPMRCSQALRPGLEGAELRAWLAELRRIAAHWDHAVDWQAIRIRDIY